MPACDAAPAHPRPHANGLQSFVTFRWALGLSGGALLMCLAIAGFVLNFTAGRVERVEQRLDKRLDEIETKIDRLPRQPLRSPAPAPPR